jgi:hypothetical protein
LQLQHTCEGHGRKEVEGYLPVRFGIIDFFALGGRLQSLVVSVLKTIFCFEYDTNRTAETFLKTDPDLQCCGSVTFWYGSGSADPCPRLMDPDPAIFAIDLKDTNKKSVKKVFLLIIF